MLNKFHISAKDAILIIYLVLATVTLAIYWQVNHFDFVNIDDLTYVTQNDHVQSGITLEGIRWAFSTTHAEFWHPLTWLSLMLDYQLYGLNAGAFHMTNLILHILSTLLLFWLFHRMTGEIWKSAFVAAFFALHPLHVESVAWIAERKDVLSAFFWMLTLCLYVYYTENPAIKRYLLVLGSFILALMSKSMVVTLPVIMILLDYWPLKRFQSQNDRYIAWQLKEKWPFFMMSVIFAMITIFAQPNATAKAIPLILRLANAPVSFLTYLAKSFFPQHMAVFYPFPLQLPVWQVIGSVVLILGITSIVIAWMKCWPYLFFGWFWYAITLAPVIGIVAIGYFKMADRYYYLPSVGIAVMLAWGIPLLIKKEETRKNVFPSAAIAVLIILAIITWKQCSYWKTSLTLFNHTLQLNQDNYFAHDGLGIALLEKGEIEKAINHFGRAIQITPDYTPAYINRGNAYSELGRYQQAIADHNKAIRLISDSEKAYNNRGIIYEKMGHYHKALEDYNTALNLNNGFPDAYNNRGNIYHKLGDYQQAIKNYTKAIDLKSNYPEAYINRGVVYEKLGHYDKALEDYNTALSLKKDFPDAYNNRGIIFGKLGKYRLAVNDFDSAIKLRGNYFEAYNNRGFSFYKMGQHQLAIDNFNKAIAHKPDYADAFSNRAVVYFTLGNKKFGCMDAQKACALENCKTLASAKKTGYCF